MPAGQPLGGRLAKGLAAYLNSTLVDSSFREWSGHPRSMRAISGDSPIRPAPSSKAVGSSIGEDLSPAKTKIDHRLRRDLLDMASLKEVARSVRVKKRIAQGRAVLKALGLPAEQQNDRSALTLLALLDLKPTTPWAKAQDPFAGSRR